MRDYGQAGESAACQYFRKKLYERLRSFPEMKICEINGQVGEGGR